MPRRAPRRARRDDAHLVRPLDPAVLEFLLDGDHRRALDAMKARGLPHGECSIVWRNADLARVWKAHRLEILREAKRLKVDIPWGIDYDRFDLRTDTFRPDPNPDPEPAWLVYPNDPRRLMAGQ